MNGYTYRSFSVIALLYLGRLLSASGRRIWMLAKALGAWLERRHAARVALEQLSAMSDLELQDIGIGRSDIERIARERLQERDVFRID